MASRSAAVAWEIPGSSRKPEPCSTAAPLAAPRPSQRGRALLQLVEGEFQLYGAQLALRRLARVSCYFAKFLATFRQFREEVQHISGLHDFRFLVKRHFI